ncbi:MAG: hypothetical protein SGILL_008316 [Bacillariaceae sp.]
MTHEDRMAGNDIPFDQASDAAARESASATSAFVSPAALRRNRLAAQGMLSKQQQQQHVSSPMRNPRLSDFDDSNLSPVSTRFESIWLSSPEQTPDRPVKTTVKTSSQQPFIKKHLPKKDELDETEGRFTMAQPRFSDPQPWTGSLSASQPPTTRALKVPSQRTPAASKSSTNQNSSRQAERTVKPPAVQQYASSAAADSLRKPVVHQYEHDMAPAAATVVTTRSSHTATTRTAAQQRYSLQGEDNDTHLRSKDEDTLFDFNGKTYSKEVALEDENAKNVKVTHKIRRRTRQRREQQQVATETDDDTSVENYGAQTIPATSLQERTHQAWKSRQKKNSSLRSSPKASDPSLPKAAVSFGKQNTVHHFQRSAHEEYEKQRLEDEVSVDRSLNSEYTKTLESEVEDMIKDILFIGNSGKSKPGRRKYKDRPEIRRKLRQQSQQEQLAAEERDANYESNADTMESTIEDESTIPSVDPEPAPKVLVDRRSMQQDKKSESRKTRQAALNDSIDSLVSSQAPTKSTILSDDRSSVVSASSLDSGTVGTQQTVEADKNDGDNDPFTAMVGLVEGGLSAVTSAIGYAFADTETKDEDTARSREVRSKESSQNKSVQSSGDHFNFFESCLGGGTPTIEGDGAETNRAISSGIVDKLGQDIWKNSAISKSFSNPAPLKDENSLTESAASIGEMDRQLEELNKNSKVSVLALHAAHSVHKIQGVEYDESIPIDMTKDLKVCPVNLKLPLGIIFVENDGESNAARSGGVEVGDQLACINGASSVHMKVDDICDVIANSSDPTQVDLVFLRYVGPFRAANKTLLETEDNFRLDAHGSFDDSLVKDKESKSLWRKNPVKSNKKEPAKTESSAKKKGGFRLFGRGKNNNAN